MKTQPSRLLLTRVRPSVRPSGGKPRAPLAQGRGGTTGTSRRSTGLLRMAAETEKEKDGVAMEAPSDVSRFMYLLYPGAVGIRMYTAVHVDGVYVGPW